MVHDAKIHANCTVVETSDEFKKIFNAATHDWKQNLSLHDGGDGHNNFSKNELLKDQM